MVNNRFHYHYTQMSRRGTNSLITKLYKHWFFNYLPRVSKNIFLQTLTNFLFFSGSWYVCVTCFLLTQPSSSDSLKSSSVFTRWSIHCRFLVISSRSQKCLNIICLSSSEIRVRHLNRQFSVHPSRTVLATIGTPFLPVPSVPETLAFLAATSIHNAFWVKRFLVSVLGWFVRWHLRTRKSCASWWKLGVFSPLWSILLLNANYENGNPMVNYTTAQKFGYTCPNFFPHLKFDNSTKKKDIQISGEGF